MKDTIVSATVAGIAATLFTSVVEWGLQRVGVTPGAVSAQYVALLILPPDHAIDPAVVSACVLLSGLTASVVFGFLLIWLLKQTGMEYWPVKALGYGGVLFILHVSLIPKLWEPRILPLLNGSAIMAWEVLSKLAWALVVAYLANRMGTFRPSGTTPS